MRGIKGAFATAACGALLLVAAAAPASAHTGLRASDSGLDARPFDLPDGAAGARASARFEPRWFRWSSRTVRYFNLSPKLEPYVRRAAAAWNGSGVRFRWKAVPRRRADLLISLQELPRDTAGLADTSGRGTRGRIRVDPLPFQVEISPRFRSTIIGTTLTHEMGHVMGLAHERNACATMNPSIVWRSCPEPPAVWMERCRLLQPDDVRGAVSLWGGRPRGLGSMFCAEEPEPPPLGPVAAEPGGTTGSDFGARLTARVPEEAPARSFLVGAAGWPGAPCPAQDFAANGGQDGVLGKNDFGDVAGVEAAPGRDQSIVLSTGVPLAQPPPTVCFGLRLYGRWGRPGPMSAATVAFPPPG